MRHGRRDQECRNQHRQRLPDRFSQVAQSAIETLLNHTAAL
jgi:hypothetical protein